MSSITVDSIEKERNAYVLKTYFFSVFNKALTDKKTKVYVERKFMQNNGNPCYPDFYCDDGHAKDRVIFEHKGSISLNERFIQKEIELTEKYLELEDSVIVKDVVLIVPTESGSRLVEVAREVGTALVLWSFDFNIDKRTLTFNSLHNRITVNKCSWLLSEPIIFQLAWCSLRRFLRDEPPVVYTAEILWNIVLRSFYNHGLSFKESYELDFSDVVDVAKRFYPGGPDSAVITTERVRKALIFLNEIEWVTFPNDANGVTVHRKRIREDLVSKVLCEEYCNTQVGVQTKIDEF